MPDTGRAVAPALDLVRRHGQRGHKVYAHRLLGEVYARRDPPGVTPPAAHSRNALALAESLGMRPSSAPSVSARSTPNGQTRPSLQHLTTATTMYRDMDLTYWLEQSASGEEEPTSRSLRSVTNMLPFSGTLVALESAGESVPVIADPPPIAEIDSPSSVQELSESGSSWPDNPAVAPAAGGSSGE